MTRDELENMRSVLRDYATSDAFLHASPEARRRAFDAMRTVACAMDMPLAKQGRRHAPSVNATKAALGGTVAWGITCKLWSAMTATRAIFGEGAKVEKEWKDRLKCWCEDEPWASHPGYQLGMAGRAFPGQAWFASGGTTWITSGKPQDGWTGAPPPRDEAVQQLLREMADAYASMRRREGKAPA